MLTSAIEQEIIVKKPLFPSTEIVYFYGCEVNKFNERLIIKLKAQKSASLVFKLAN